MDLKGRDFLKLLDFTPEEIGYLIDLAADLKAKKKAGIPHRYCEGKRKRPASRTGTARARTSPSSSKRPAPGPAAALKWRPTTSAWGAPT